MIKSLKSTLGSAYVKYKNYEKARLYNGIALKMLANVEAAKGKTDPKLLKSSDEYAVEVLGDKIHAAWLYFYSAVAGEFKEGWIPDLYYSEVVMPVIKGPYGHISHLNPLNLSLFRDDSFPDIGSYVNGLFFDESLTSISENELKKRLFRNRNKIVFKVDDGRKGRGVFVLDRTSFDPNKIKVLGNGVFQEFISQHEWFDGIMPNSVGTLRVTTVIDDEGEISVRAIHLRVGRTDDTHVQSPTQVRVAVDHRTGILMDEGYMPDWRTIDRHPDTGFTFSGKEVPGLEKCKDKAIALHRAMPFARCIGWDMTLDSDLEVKTMEWNGAHNGIKFSEPTAGPCFADLGWENLWRTK